MGLQKHPSHSLAYGPVDQDFKVLIGAVKSASYCWATVFDAYPVEYKLTSKIQKWKFVMQVGYLKCLL